MDEGGLNALPGPFASSLPPFSVDNFVKNSSVWRSLNTWVSSFDLGFFLIDLKIFNEINDLHFCVVWPAKRLSSPTPSGQLVEYLIQQAWALACKMGWKH
jgi:hypothetical protein